jgi:hypothetical protein
MNRDTPNSVRLLVWLAHNLKTAVDATVCNPKPPWLKQDRLVYSDLHASLQFYSNTPQNVRLGLLPLHLVIHSAKDATEQAARIGIRDAEILVWMFNGIFFFTEGKLGHPLGRVTSDSTAQQSLERRIQATTFVQKITTFKVDKSRDLDDEDNDF